MKNVYRGIITRMNSKQVVKLTNSKVTDSNFRKLTNSKIGKADFRKVHNTGENFLTESRVYKLIFKSKKASYQL
ncbi:MAG: hypothetical protein E6980_16420 [Clostridium sp.]|nr:hypothetical protein [Clostridium sp.]